MSEVRWRVAATSPRSFLTRALADSYRAELIRAARHGLELTPPPANHRQPRARQGRAATSSLNFLDVRCRNGVPARAAAPELATITSMPKKPVASTDELTQMLMRVETAAAGVLEQQMLHRLRQQTYVGGRRVDIQKLPRLPKKRLDQCAPGEGKPGRARSRRCGGGWKSRAR